MASAPAAASAGDAAQRAPRAIRSSAFALLRFQTAVVKPGDSWERFLAGEDEEDEVVNWKVV